jgi:RNA polymerase sigma-70 factor (ECF subfamily)
MPSSAKSSGSVASGAAPFAVTRWSVVMAARQSDSSNARAALEELCRTYWRPIYSFVRRQGHSPADAQDLTQEFFARLLAKNYLSAVDSAKGRFRSFLLAALKHFLANEWDKAKAQKRGGNLVLVPIDSQSAETVFGLELAERLTADKIFDRRWALTLLDQVLARLRAEYVRQRKGWLFEELKSTLTGERSSVPYADIGARLNLSEGAVKVSVHRLRQRYRELLREEIAHTVASPDEIEDELRNLFAALAS